MSDFLDGALFYNDEQIVDWTQLPATFTVTRTANRAVFRTGGIVYQQNVLLYPGTEIKFERNDGVISSDVIRCGVVPDDGFTTEDAFGDPEWDLIGLVCDQIDRANPDLPIEVCQAIARDIIKLVREYS